MLPLGFMALSPGAVDVSSWSPDSWRGKPALQQPDYPDSAELQCVLDELRQLPPLVTSWEILNLREQLAEAVAGKRFVYTNRRPTHDCERSQVLQANVEMSANLLVYRLATELKR